MLLFAPDPARDPVPAGGAAGNGAIVTVDHEPTADLADAELVAQAFELALKSTNRALHALAFAAHKERPVPLLSGEDLEDKSCIEDPGGAARALPVDGLFSRQAVRIKLDAADRTDVVQKVMTPLPADFVAAHALWVDAIEAFYAGRLREAVVLARAAVEVGWEIATKAAAQDLATQARPPIQAQIFEAYVAEGLESRALKDRLDKYNKALLGFSFCTDWTPGRWEHLVEFFELRNNIAHEGFHPSPDKAFRAIALTRDVLSKLVELRLGVVPRP
ncbi:MAG: hypothetical protein KIS78_02655 [Labilithrix sp.]|nr:hypothetical protein [Labilithrix sp.]